MAWPVAIVLELYASGRPMVAELEPNVVPVALVMPMDVPPGIVPAM